MMQLRSRARARSEPPTGRTPTAVGACEEEVAGIREGRYWVRWQVYLREWDCWKSYSISQSSCIEAAWQAGAAGVDIGEDEESSDTWHINLIALMQSNLRSGTSRPIHRMLITHK